MRDPNLSMNFLSVVLKEILFFFNEVSIYVIFGFIMAGDCIMPREGIFGMVLKGGKIHCRDMIRIMRDL